MNTIKENIEYAVKHWWLSLLVGVLFVIAGIMIMFTPIVSYITLSILFSMFLIIAGVLEIIFAVRNKENIAGWGWYLAGGIIDLVLGIYLVVNPVVSMAVLPYILAFWLIFRGISIIAYSMDLKRYNVKGWGWNLFFGIVAILCAIYIFWQPLVGALSIVYLVAFSLIFIGVFRIILAFQLKNIKKKYTHTRIVEEI
ncbi:MAG: HdeD family acid-resistance protein [Tannerellaceae bacterium]|nr:HdeD family acid-resistance protein [Tannerellaceae bacterium]